jgi:hypothetical protein
MWAALASVAVGGWLVAPASAQFGGYQRPYQNPYPAFSPILNMSNGGGNPAINYFGIVRPQMQTASALQQLQMNQQMLLTNQGGMQMPFALPLDAQPNMLTTGHNVGFNDYSRFFPIQGFRTGAPGTPTTGVPTTGGGGYFPATTGGFGMRR